jgi:hypothetical protein
MAHDLCFENLNQAFKKSWTKKATPEESATSLFFDCGEGVS